jgi:hypothetical protein
MQITGRMEINMDTYIGYSFKFILKVGVEESIVNTPPAE